MVDIENLDVEEQEFWSRKLLGSKGCFGANKPFPWYFRDCILRANKPDQGWHRVAHPCSLSFVLHMPAIPLLDQPRITQPTTYLPRDTHNDDVRSAKEFFETFVPEFRNSHMLHNTRSTNSTLVLVTCSLSILLSSNLSAQVKCGEWRIVLHTA